MSESVSKEDLNKRDICQDLVFKTVVLETEEQRRDLLSQRAIRRQENPLPEIKWIPNPNHTNKL